MKTCSYTEELGARICEAIAGSEKGLAHICAENDFPAPSTIYDWLNKKKEFRRQYVFAKEMQTETICTKILAIADSPCLREKKITKTCGDTTVTTVIVEDNTAQRQLQIATRQWLLKNLMLSKHGYSLEAQREVQDRWNEMNKSDQEEEARKR